MNLGCPVLVGPSRKAFIGHLLNDPEADRTAGTIGVACAQRRKVSRLMRVHDVAAVRQALQLFDAVRGAGACGDVDSP